MKEERYVVRVSCMTYNHAAYVVDAMNGFVMQQTRFPFVCTIVDDASTDGEQEVIKKYMQEHFDLQDASVAYEKDTDYGHVIFAQHKTNKNCYFAVILLKENHYSQRKSKAPYLTEWKDIKYLALCEGDDYWTDPMKLQKQVEFLEEHEEYVLCAHNSITRDGNTGAMGCFNGWFDKSAFNYEEIISKDWFLPTQSLLYRKDVGVRNRVEKSFHNGDYCLQLCLTRDGGLVHYSNECMSVYRRGVGISKHDSAYDNNLRLIELLKYMKELSDVKYEKVFDERIDELNRRNEAYIIFEKNKKNAKKMWYRIRFGLLYYFAKFLGLKEPNVVLYKDYWR